MKQLLISPKALLVIAAVIVILGLAAAPGYYFYQKYQKSQQLLNNPTQVAADELKEVKTKVGKLIDLPDGEEPTLATVSDKNKLKDQPFFQKAENRDKVLIYTQAKKAILYRPSINKIIEVSTLNIGKPAEVTASSSAVQAIKIALRNGTSVIGLTNKFEPELKKTLSNIEVTSKENASKNNFDKSVIVVLNEQAKDAASSLNKALNINIGDLPSGENKPQNTDILIILGKDKSL